MESKQFKSLNEAIKRVVLGEKASGYRLINNMSKYVDKQMHKQRWKLSKNKLSKNKDDDEFILTSGDWKLQLRSDGNLEWDYKGVGAPTLSGEGWTNGMGDEKDFKETVDYIVNWLEQNPGSWD